MTSDVEWVQVGNIRVRPDILAEAREEQAKKERRKTEEDRRERARRAGGEVNPRARRRDA